MRKNKHPTWIEWQNQVMEWVEHAVKHASLTGFRINGDSTHKHISIQDPATSLHNMPYVQVGLIGNQRGWNDDNEGQANPNSYVYTDIGGRYLKEQVEMKERLFFEIEVFSNIQKECVEIADTIHRFFLPNASLIFNWNSSQYGVETRFLDMVMEKAESDRAGSIEFFRAYIRLQLATTAMTLTPDDVVPAVKTAVITITESEGAEITKELQE